MKLHELLEFDEITIQCHDNPDADALASGYALYTYLSAHGKKPRFIYSGKLKIAKGNLVIMVDELEIPITYVRDNTEKINGVLITVDCQYGALNVTKFQTDRVLVIDHHQPEIETNDDTYILSNMGSCSTILWKMMQDEDFKLDEYPELQTALYYGLYTDSGQFSGMMNPVDKDMADSLKPDHSLINRLQNSNISFRELEIAGVAMIRSVINQESHFAVIKAEPCDPNILGVISDLVIQVNEINFCIVFTVFDYGIKFSVRSCVKEVKANHLAAYVSKNIGSGGGHLYKAGGFIGMKEYQEQFGEYEIVTYFMNSLTKYHNGYEIIDTRKYQYDQSDAKLFQKIPMHYGYVKVSEFIEEGVETVVRTLEGDLHVTVTDDLYIIIGIKGEIYPVREAKFFANYSLSDEPYTQVLEYSPKAKIMGTDRSYDLLEYARSCYSTGTGQIYAKELERGVKVFTEWDRECYMLGEPGDYLACRIDDNSDVYVIEKQIFHMTYKEV